MSVVAYCLEVELCEPGVHCCLWRGQWQIWLKLIDFKSPEAETVMLRRLPCQPLCSLACAVVVHKLTTSGMGRHSLSTPFVLLAVFCAAARRWVCVAHEVAKSGPDMSGDPSMQVKLTVDNFWCPYMRTVSCRRCPRWLQRSCVVYRHPSVDCTWARLRPSPQCGIW